MFPGTISGETNKEISCKVAFSSLLTRRLKSNLKNIFLLLFGEHKYLIDSKMEKSEEEERKNSFYAVNLLRCSTLGSTFPLRKEAFCKKLVLTIL